MTLDQAVQQVLPSVRADLERLVRIPSVSADPAAAPHLRSSAALVAALLEAAGLPEVDVLAVPGGQPAVVARRPAPPGAPTVLLYAHHDVQPPGDRASWDTDPFQPTETDGRLFGRGAADDKAGIAVHLAALRAHGDRLPVGVTVLVEGEEEIGSPTLLPFLEMFRDRLAADVVVFADAVNWTADVPSLTTSLRGGATVTVELRTLDHAVHSGLFGGPVPDALTSLCRLLATLHDERGDVAVAGLTRGTADPVDLTEARCAPTPGCWTGYSSSAPAASPTGCGPPPRSPSSPWTRPPPRTPPTRCSPPRGPRSACGSPPATTPTGPATRSRPTCGRTHRGARTSPSTSGVTAAPYTVPTGGKAYQAARQALTQAWGRPALDIGVGGSIPFVTAYAERFPDAEILITGVEDPDARAHGANESLHLLTFERACLAEALFLDHLASG